MRDEPADELEPGSAPRRGVPGYVSWGIRDLVIGVVAVSVLFVVAGAATYPVVDAYGEDAAETVLAQTIAQIAWYGSVVFVVYTLVRRQGGSWRNLGFRPAEYTPPESFTRLQHNLRLITIVRLPRAVLAVLGGYFGSIFVVQVYSILVEVFGIDALQPSQQIPDSYFESDWLVPLIGVAVVIAAPFAEETLFRGFVYAGLRRYLGVWPAAFASGGLFSLAHGDPGLILPFALVGAILAYAYERTGTLYVPIAVHLTFNLLAFLVLVFVPDWRGS